MPCCCAHACRMVASTGAGGRGILDKVAVLSCDCTRLVSCICNTIQYPNADSVRFWIDSHNVQLRCKQIRSELTMIYSGGACAPCGRRKAILPSSGERPSGEVPEEARLSRGARVGRGSHGSMNGAWRRRRAGRPSRIRWIGYAAQKPIVSATRRLPQRKRECSWLRVVGHLPAIAGAHSWCLRCQSSNELVLRQSALCAMVSAPVAALPLLLVVKQHDRDALHSVVGRACLRTCVYSIVPYYICIRPYI